MIGSLTYMHVHMCRIQEKILFQAACTSPEQTNSLYWAPSGPEMGPELACLKELHGAVPFEGPQTDELPAHPSAALYSLLRGSVSLLTC